MRLGLQVLRPAPGGVGFRAQGWDLRFQMHHRPLKKVDILLVLNRQLIRTGPVSLQGYLAHKKTPQPPVTP
jgi:hypothetical protein